MIQQPNRMVEIVNTVGSGSVGRELDVEQLAEVDEFPFTRYEPDVYHGLYVRYDEDGPLVTVYRTGKYIVTGANELVQMEETKPRFLTSLQSLGIIESAVDDSFSTRNVVCTGDLSSVTDLSRLAIMLGLDNVEYEPEQFPGLIYRPESHPCVITVFSTGKVVVTGATSVETAEKAIQYLKDEIRATGAA